MNLWAPKLAVWLVVSSVCAVTSALSHEISPSVADVSIVANTVRIEVDLTLETLLAGVDASVYSDTNDSPQAREYDRLRGLAPDDLRDELNRAWPRVSPVFIIQPVGGDPIAPVLIEADIGAVGDVDLPRESRLIITAPLPPGSSAIEVGARRSLGPLILRHKGAGDDAFAGLLAPGEISPPLPRQGGAAETGGATFVRYLALGYEHIVPKGLDHILFVLGLFFFALQVRPLLTQVTAFTVAHTVTLAVAALGIISVPAAIVEPLIAASIVFVAVENLRGGDLGRGRTAVVFGFGLLHGLGFASVLGDIGLAQGQFLVSLIGFNLGVEAGQLSVIAAAWFLVGLWFGRRWFYDPWIARPASVLIGAIGAWWVVERVFVT